MSQAAVLKPSQHRHLLRVTEATSRDPERDILVLLLGIHTGMRISEIAQIEVQDTLFPSGAIRQEVSLRAAIQKDVASGAYTQRIAHWSTHWIATWLTGLIVAGEWVTTQVVFAACAKTAA